MEIVVVKVLSALVLWILSLCFGLMVPCLIWRSKAGYRQQSCQGQHGMAETESLLSDEESPVSYDTAIREPESNWASLRKSIKNLYGGICKYDVISFINCVCGGLFLGICLLELLPESRQYVETILADAKLELNFPVTEFTICVGLLLVMFIEHAVTGICARRIASQSRNYDVISGEGAGRNENSSSSSLDSASDTCNERRENSANQNSGHCPTNCDVRRERRRSNAEVYVTSEATRALVLIGMLSVHSVFEGLALGLSSTVNQLIQLLVAVSVHKSLLAFGLGLRLFETFAPDHLATAVACALVFCSSSPLGCAIGLLISPGDNNNMTVTTPTTPTNTWETLVSFHEDNLSKIPGTLYATAVLQCLATGTFLYVTFVEVIPQEFSHANDHDVINGVREETSNNSRKIPIKPIVKLFALLLGFATVTGLQFI